MTALTVSGILGAAVQLEVLVKEIADEDRKIREAKERRQAKLKELNAWYKDHPYLWWSETVEVADGGFFLDDRSEHREAALLLLLKDAMS